MNDLGTIQMAHEPHLIACLQKTPFVIYLRILASLKLHAQENETIPA